MPVFTPPEGTLTQDTLDHCFYLEVIKDKQSIGKQPLSRRGHYIFGRSDQIHVQVIHPSLSRQHAVVMHMMVGKDGEEKKPGICVMDLGSANATHINGKKIKPKIPYPMKPDYYFCLGKSTRRYYVRHDPSLEKPNFNEESKKRKHATITKNEKGDKQKVAVRKLSEAEIKKLQAKKVRQGTQSLGARKLVSSQFRNLVEQPRTAPQGLAVTLEDMMASAEAEQPKDDEAEQVTEAEQEDEDELGDDPEAEDTGRSWLIKPDNAVAKDEDSD